MKLRFFSALVLFLASYGITSAAFTAFPVSAYLQASDSPLVAGAGEQYTLVDFESGPVGTWTFPGISAVGLLNSVDLAIIDSGTFTDSVDADDGSIDGSGQNGRSLADPANQPVGDAGYSFTFDAMTFGTLPTQVGIVWTDGDNSARPVTVEFFDELGGSIGTITSGSLGDGGFSGGTTEDRFFGASDSNGIGGFIIRQPNSDNSLEVDHLQWVVVPEASHFGVISALLVFSRTLIGRRHCRS